MKLTDIFIRRPVLATVISLLIVVLGLMAFKQLSLRQFPDIQLAQVNVSASYPGASAEVMQGFVTTPIEDAISGIDNIDYMTASSWEGGSSITVNLFPGSNADIAVSQIITKIQQIKGSNLPSAMDEPTVQKGNPGSEAIMFLSFYSDQMTPEQIGDYVTRVIRPKLQAVPGVSSVSAMGSRSYAMRLWLDPQKMAAAGVQPLDVENAIKNNNVQSTAGSIQSQDGTISVQANTGLISAKDFNNMVIRTSPNGTLVYLSDIGHAELGASSYNNEVLSNGKVGTLVQITNKAGANPLDVANGVKKLLPSVLNQLPPAMQGEVVYDLSDFIQQSIHTVIETILEAAIIVVIIIFLCLGSIRSVFIPMLTIPISLIGVMAVMLLFHFSLNVLTLLAMVLAIGLVVDDSIVVVENISRHLEEGLTPLQAAFQGAREIASPIITMTITLISVFIPIGFSGGITGALFSEFAFTLAGTVFLSAVVALTLSPMLCSRILSREQLQGRFVKRVDKFFATLSANYQEALRAVLDMRYLVLAFAVAILISVAFLYHTTQSELAPNEDQSLLEAQAEGPVNANIYYTNKYMQQVSQMYNRLPGIKDAVVISGQGGINQAQSFLFLQPLDQRTISQMELVNRVNAESKN
ncbi:MAG: efflux RND transporter permease subunit, partial [Gammaproteobacteria bacterium]|nr:efflux RND transporter permease subunit [Gammaproteobacteria bacterium]